MRTRSNAYAKIAYPLLAFAVIIYPWTFGTAPWWDNSSPSGSSHSSSKLTDHLLLENRSRVSWPTAERTKSEFQKTKSERRIMAEQKGSAREFTVRSLIPPSRRRRCHQGQRSTQVRPNSPENANLMPRDPSPRDNWPTSGAQGNQRLEMFRWHDRTAQIIEGVRRLPPVLVIISLIMYL